MFDGDDKDTKIAVESTTDGVRALIAIDSAKAPERFDFHLGGDVAKLELTETGGAVALARNGEVLGYIEAPWAVDAQGRNVPTRFEISETSLTQVVEHHREELSYPVVADPKVFRCDLSTAMCLKLTKKETKRLWKAVKPHGPSKALKAAAALCRFVPHKVISTGCTAIVFPYIVLMRRSIKNAAEKGRCFELHVPILGPQVLRWKTVKC